MTADVDNKEFTSNPVVFVNVMIIPVIIILISLLAVPLVTVRLWFRLEHVDTDVTWAIWTHSRFRNQRSVSANYTTPLQTLSSFTKYGKQELFHFVASILPA